MQEEAKSDLDTMIEAERAKGRAITVGVREGNAAKEAFKFVNEEMIDLLVMGAYEEDRVAHFFFGRTVEKITRKMPCSVMLVKEEPHPAS